MECPHVHWYHFNIYYGPALISIFVPLNSLYKRLLHLRPYQNELEHENAMATTPPSLPDFSGQWDL